MMIAFLAWAMSQNKRSANDRARAKNFLGLLLSKLASTLGGDAVVKVRKSGSQTWNNVVLRPTLLLDGSAVWPLAAGIRNSLRDEWNWARRNERRAGLIESSFDTPSIMDYIMYGVDAENRQHSFCEPMALSLLSQLCKIIDENASQLGDASKLQAAIAFKKGKDFVAHTRSQMCDAALSMWSGVQPSQSSSIGPAFWLN